MKTPLRIFLLAAVLVALHLGLTIFLLGCSSTVTPAPVAVQQASYEAGEQNSGVLAPVPGGALITANARARYNGLIEIYGGEFIPAIAADHGVTPEGDGTFRLTNEALQKFILMSTWRRMGREPGSNSKQ